MASLAYPHRPPRLALVDGETTKPEELEEEKMMSKLAAFIQAERLKRGLSLGKLARMVGYRNIAKGARRIIALERTGMAKPDLLVNVAEALDLDWTVVERLVEEDHQERLRKWGHGPRSQFRCASWSG
jgi:hypothetical protein